MAFLRDLAPVAICAMNEYPKCSDDGWRQLQSIQADEPNKAVSDYNAGSNSVA